MRVRSVLQRREETQIKTRDINIEDIFDSLEAQDVRSFEEIEAALQENGWIVKCGMFVLGACDPKKCPSCQFRDYLEDHAPKRL